MPFSITWDETSPVGSQDMSLGDDRIREFKTQMRERLGVDHHFLAADDANTGYHEKATLINQNSDPVQVANALILYVKTVGGSRELFSRHESAALQQLTYQGKLWLAALGMAGLTTGDIFYFDGSVVNRLALGTALQQLRANAGATAPEWFTAAAAYVPNTARIISTSVVTIAVTGYGNDLTNASVSFTSTGRDAKITFNADILYNGFDTGGKIIVDIDGSTIANSERNFSVTQYLQSHTMVSVYAQNLAAGVHTITMRALDTAGGQSYKVGGRILLVEEL